MKKSELRQMIREELLKEGTNVKTFLRKFRDNYGYITHSLSDKEVERFLNQSSIKKLSLAMQMDAFSDYLVSQGIADDVVESEEAKLRKMVREEVKKLNIR